MTIHPKLQAYMDQIGAKVATNNGGKRAKVLSLNHETGTIGHHTCFYKGLCDLFNNGREDEAWYETQHCRSHITIRGFLKKDGILNYNVSGSNIQFVNII